MLQRLLRDPVIKSARAILPGAPGAEGGGSGSDVGGEVEMGRDVAPKRAALLIPGTEAAKRARLGVAAGASGRDGSVGAGAEEKDALVGEKGKGKAPIREEDDFFKGVDLGLGTGESLLFLSPLLTSTPDPLPFTCFRGPT